MDFNERLKKAVARGQRRNDEAGKKAREKELSAAEIRQQHSKFRLQLSEQIEQCLQRLPNHIPGFRYETVFGDRGWGGACYRDDLGVAAGGKRTNYYSRIEMTIKPLSSYNILELAGKATVRNKELFTRSHHDDVETVDVDVFSELIDLWIVEFAEQYSATER